MSYLFIEACIGDSKPWAGRARQKDSDASNLPAYKGTLAICLAFGINYESAIVIIFIEACAFSKQASYNINNTFHSTHIVLLDY